MLASGTDKGSKGFNLVKSFLSQLVGMIDIDNGDARVVPMTYGSYKATHHFRFNHPWTVRSLQKHISLQNLGYPVEGTGPNTALALKSIRTEDMRSDRGDRSRVRNVVLLVYEGCLLYTSPSPRDGLLSRMPSSA